MTCAKLLLIVPDPEARRRLLATWEAFVIRQPGAAPDDGPGASRADGPVVFSRLRIRDGLSLALFIVDGGWRREYVCQVLAEEVDGFCLLLGDTPADLSAAAGLAPLLAGRRPGLIVGTAEGCEAVLREALGLSPEARLAIVDCDDGRSVMGAVCELLERVAAVPAA